MGTRRDDGFSLLEVTIVIGILTFGIISMVAVFTSVTQMNQSAIETDRAIQAERSKIEEIRSITFSAVFANYSAGGTPGNTFAVSGLPPTPSGGTNQGTITFLGETDVASYWGTSADFNGDGVTNSAAPANASQAVSWTALPLSIGVTWQDRIKASPRSVTFTTIIYNQGQ